MIGETHNVIFKAILEYWEIFNIYFSILLSFQYKKFLISLNFIYYFTIFFWLTRVTVYAGITLITLINTKHTTIYKKKSVRSPFNIWIKHYNTFNLKKNYLKLISYVYL